MSSIFATLELDQPLWTQTVKLGQADLFYQVDYCRFRYGGSQDRALMLRYEDDLGVVFDVSVKRPISQLSFFEDIADEFSLPPVDLVSPEYNGPIVIGSRGDRAELVRRYRRSLSEYCAQQGVVTEFVRIHPFSGCADELGRTEPLIVASDTVYVDLSCGYEAATKRYRRDRRARVKQARASGSRAEIVAATPERVARLANVYAETMARHGAREYYAHDLEFFRSLYNHLREHAIMVEAYGPDERLASVRALLVGPSTVWAFYAGTVESQRGSGANHLSYDVVNRWAAEQGYARVCLGGGFSENDALYEYKLGFSPLVAPVRHLRKVHDAGVLARLVAAKAAFDRRKGHRTRTDYFPSYWFD